jgi:ATP-binding cassette subfamily B protein
MDESGVTARKSDIAAAWRHYRGFHRQILEAGAATAVGTFAELLVLAILATLTSLIGTGQELFTASFLFVSISLTTGQLLLITVVLILVRGAFRQIDTMIEANLASRYEDKTRGRLMNAYLSASWPAQSGQRASQLQDVATSAVLNGRVGIKALASALGDSASALIMLAGAVTASLITTVVAILVSAVFVLALLPLVRRSKALSGEVTEASLSYSASLGETVDLSREIRLFGVDVPFGSRLQGLSTHLRVLRRREQTLIGTAPIIFETAALLLVISGFSALYVLNLGNSTRFVALLLVLLRASQYGRSVQSVYHQMRSSLPYLDLIDDREAELLAATPPSGSVVIERLELISLRDVSYSYDAEHDALAQVSLSVTAGDTLGVIGPSGSGKSTLVELLLGLRHPTSGSIELNGVDLRELQPAAFHRLTGLVSQDARLIEGDVRDNVRFLRDDVTDEDIAYGIAGAGLDRDLASLRNGLETPIGPRSSGLSGGQRQRLSIARVLAGRPQLLILDEPTSALDVHAESVVTDTLDRLKGTITVVVVAHRLSTLRICESVMVMRDGHVDAFGSRTELERDNTYYRSAIELAHLTA